MTGQRAVIVPFGVPVPARGLGLGLAALLHGFTVIDGQSVGLAQLFARPREDGGDGLHAADPIETFVPPASWRDLAGGGPGAPDVALVITGSFEPPREGRGMLQILAFDARDGSTRARTEAHLDTTTTGATILTAFEEVWAKLGGDLGLVRGIGDLAWDSLESVLRAERCVLHDPERHGPHDRLAALLHLGRAVSDAPLARFPSGRLAVVALETVSSPAIDPKLVHAALRALDRAAEDAPSQLDLIEASAALHARLGHAREAEAEAVSALERAPDRGRLYAILSEARRSRGDLDGALEAVDAGLRQVRDDGLLATERGLVLARRGDLIGAEAAWRGVLAHDAVFPAAFVNLATLAAEKKDLLLAQALADEALAAPHAHPEVLRRAIQLIVATEPDGIPRAARIAKLATTVVERVTGDAWGFLVLAQARVRLGESASALVAFSHVIGLAPTSALAAEAQRERLACQDPQASLEVEAVIRAAETAEKGALEGVAARARSLAASHAVWTAAFAGGVAEKRLGRWTAARVAFEEALVLSSGATPAHLELVEVCLVLGDAAVAVEHAERAASLEGKSQRVLVALALAFEGAGRALEAVDAARAALIASPDEARLLAIVERGVAEKRAERPSFWEALRKKVTGD